MQKIFTALAGLTASLALSASAQASKSVDSTIGTKSGSPALGGTFDDLEGVAVRQSTGQLYVSDKDNHRIQRFSAAGVFERAWGWDVVQPGGSGDTVDGSFEICVAASQCKAGAPGGGGGQFGELNFTMALTIDQATGEIYVSDNRNRRIQKFDADGNFLRTWGREVVVSGPGNVGGAEICVPAQGDICQAGLEHTGTGGFNTSLKGIVVDGAGDVYVGEGSNRRIQKFDGDGTPLSLWGWDVVASGPGNLTATSEVQTVTLNATGGTFTLSFEDETTAAIPFSATAVEVRAALRKLPKLEPTGGEGQVDVAGAIGGPWTVTFVQRLGNANQPEMSANGAALTGGAATATVATVSDGATYEVCVPTNGDVCKAGVGREAAQQSSFLGAAKVGQFPTIEGFYIGVDSLNRIYASDPDAGRVQRFGADGSAPEVFTVEASESSPRQIAVDRGSGHVYLVATEGGESRIKEFDLDGALVDTHAVGAGIASDNSRPRGIALHEQSGHLYLSTTQADHWVLVLDDDGGFEAGSVTIQPATNVSTDSATLKALVNPNGFSTTYQFEYSLDGTSWTKVGSPQSAGAGTLDVPVSAAVGDLEANAEYRFRVAVATTFAGKATSAEETFTTSAAAPGAETVYPRSHTATEATLTGLLNANNSPTIYYFEYGESEDYGSKAPLPDGQASGGTVKVVTAAIEGLEPDTTYHYRLVAESDEGQAVGDDVEFITRPAPLPIAGRAFEMVTPPFKVTRGTVANGVLGANRLIAGPSLDGETVRWKLKYFPLLEETRSPFNGDELIMRRTASGWTINGLYTQPLLPQFSTQLVDGEWVGASGDLEVGAWKIGDFGKGIGAILPNESEVPLNFYTRRDGTGVEGWTGWLSNVEAQQVPGRGSILSDAALFNDDGSAMARWGDYRGLLGSSAAEDPSLTQFAGINGGRTAYRQLNPPEGPRELVNGCTGSGAAATLIPSRVGSGAASDTIGSQACAEGAVTSRRGAIVGANHIGSSHGGGEADLIGPSATALAEDGGNVYFTSPDPGAPTTPKASCATNTTLPGPATATGGNTSCPPQLYMRHYDGEGNPTVRWVSRPAPGMPIQQIGLLGPAIFQGASRDGDTVYFKTNSPLTADDPNGSGSPGPITTGTASDNSWDLYRYEAPADPVTEAGTLTRITGGPNGSADPNTNGIQGGAARFISDDGKRAYFVTNGSIASADATPPKGGGTVPGEAGGRKLYLFNANEEGAERWRFIARLPLGESADGSNSYNACASFYSVPSWDSGAKAGTAKEVFDLEGIGSGGCVRGTPDGEAITFITQGRLSSDDNDEVADVYLYDAGEDELVRVTAPRGPDSTYGCRQTRASLDAPVLTVVACRGQMIGWMNHNGTTQTNEFSRGWGGDRYMNIAKDGDGAVSVYFESKAQLLPGDENVNHWDVYEWREGELSLISRGKPERHSYFSGNSVDGRDVFIATSDRIDPRELDDGDYDIYDARRGGGFPYTPPEEPCDVLAFECESQATPAPPSANAASGAPTAGNVAPKAGKCAKGKVRRKGRCVSKPRKRAEKRAGNTRKGGRR